MLQHDLGGLPAAERLGGLEADAAAQQEVGAGLAQTGEGDAFQAGTGKTNSARMATANRWWAVFIPCLPTGQLLIICCR